MSQGGGGAAAGGTGDLSTGLIKDIEGVVDFERVWEIQMHSRGVNDTINLKWTNETGLVFWKPLSRASP